MYRTNVEKSFLNAQPAAKKPPDKNSFKLWQGIVLAICVMAVIAWVVLFLRPPETPYQHAIYLIKSGKAAAALPILEDLSKQQPDNVRLFPWLAQAYLHTDRVAEGRLALDTALRMNVFNDSMASTVLSYASYYEIKGDYEEARELYRSATKGCPPKSLSESQAKMYLKWADKLQSTDLPQAVEHLESAYALLPEISDQLGNVIRHKLSEAYRQSATIAEADDNDDKAQAILEKSVAVSDEPATRMILASIYARQKKLDQAIANYDLVAKSDNNNLEARHKLVELACVQKDYAKAQIALIELTDKEKSVENFQLLASLDLKLGNYPGAVRAFEDATDLRQKPELLKELHSVLLDWSNQLKKENKLQEALAVQGHAERVLEQLSDLTKDKDDDEKTSPDKKNNVDDQHNLPIALSFSRIWLAKGSLTPEGEIKIKNVSSQALNDLTLTAVFFDNTARHPTGSVAMSVATPQSAPFEQGASRSLYFSCPNIVKADHQLSVILFWKGRLLREFPVVKL